VQSGHFAPAVCGVDFLLFVGFEHAFLFLHCFSFTTLELENGALRSSRENL